MIIAMTAMSISMTLGTDIQANQLTAVRRSHAVEEGVAITWSDYAASRMTSGRLRRPSRTAALTRARR
jgi:hypothetical protein